MFCFCNNILISLNLANIHWIPKIFGALWELQSSYIQLLDLKTRAGNIQITTIQGRLSGSTIKLYMEYLMQSLQFWIESMRKVSERKKLCDLNLYKDNFYGKHGWKCNAKQSLEHVFWGLQCNGNIGCLWVGRVASRYGAKLNKKAELKL